ncbi:MAG: hypothetical protein ABUS48_00065 [Pseudomonadota bacterium]
MPSRRQFALGASVIVSGCAPLAAGLSSCGGAAVEAGSSAGAAAPVVAAVTPLLNIVAGVLGISAIMLQKPQLAEAADSVGASSNLIDGVGKVSAAWRITKIKNATGEPLTGYFRAVCMDQTGAVVAKNGEPASGTLLGGVVDFADGDLQLPQSGVYRFGVEYSPSADEPPNIIQGPNMLVLDDERWNYEDILARYNGLPAEDAIYPSLA